MIVAIHEAQIDQFLLDFYFQDYFLQRFVIVLGERCRDGSVDHRAQCGQAQFNLFEQIFFGDTVAV